MFFDNEKYRPYQYRFPKPIDWLIRIGSVALIAIGSQLIINNYNQKPNSFHETQPYNRRLQP